jgi:hypothetical protein
MRGVEAHGYVVSYRIPRLATSKETIMRMFIRVWTPDNKRPWGLIGPFRTKKLADKEEKRYRLAGFKTEFRVTKK